MNPYEHNPRNINNDDESHSDGDWSHVDAASSSDDGMRSIDCGSETDVRSQNDESWSIISSRQYDSYAETGDAEDDESTDILSYASASDTDDEYCFSTEGVCNEDGESDTEEAASIESNKSSFVDEHQDESSKDCLMKEAAVEHVDKLNIDRLDSILHQCDEWFPVLEALDDRHTLDMECCLLLEQIINFLDNYDDDEGIALLALKMSKGLNMMLHSVLSNDSIFGWDLRRSLYLTALRFLRTLCTSDVLIRFMEHDLLESIGQSGSTPCGSSSCFSLLSSLRDQAGVFLQVYDFRTPGPIDVCEEIKNAFEEIATAITLER